MVTLTDAQLKSTTQLIETAIHRYGFFRSETSIKLSSGTESFFYFDLKKLLGNSEFLMNLIAIYYAQFYRFNLRSIGGIESGSIPIAYGYGLYSFAEGIPMSSFYIRKNIRTHGTKNVIEGMVKSPCIIFEDVITTGKSVTNSIAKLRTAYPEVNILGIVCVIDRTEDMCKKVSKDTGLNVSSMFNFKHFLETKPKRETFSSL